MENIREDDGKSWDVGMKNFDENPSNSDRLVSDNQSKWRTAGITRIRLFVNLELSLKF